MNTSDIYLEQDMKKRQEEEDILFAEKSRIAYEIKNLERKIKRLESRNNYLDNAIVDNRQRLKFKMEFMSSMKIRDARKDENSDLKLSWIQFSSSFEIESAQNIFTRIEKGSFAANARANIDITPVSSRQIAQKEIKNKSWSRCENMSDVSNIIKSAKENLEAQFESFHSDFSRTTGDKKSKKPIGKPF